MRKIWVLAGVVAAVAIAAWLWVSTDSVSSEPEAIASERGSVRLERSVAPEKMNAVLLQPVQTQTGAGTIRGRVLNNGEPVGGATITATRAETRESLSERDCECDNACGKKLLACGCGEASEQLKTLVTERSGEVIPVGRTITAVDGTFEITQLDSGEVALWADSPRLGTSLQQHIAVGSDNVALQLGNGIALKGKVTIDGEPAPANAWVTAIHGEQSRFFDVLTQGDGSFSIGPLPVGLYSLVAGAPGALPGHQHLRKDSPTEGFEISLFTPRTITGVVLADDKPVSGVKVKLSGNHRESETVSGGDGTFRFTELRPGSHDLSASKGTLRADTEVKVPKRGNPDQATLILVESARFAGTVRSAEGPIAKATVTVRSMGQEDETRTDEDGQFELKTFAGKGANVTASAQGFADGRQNVDLISGKDTRVDFELTPEARLAGVVVDGEGQPVAGARLNAMPEGSTEYEGSGYALSHDGGTFDIKGITARTYEVKVTHPAHATLVTRLVAPALNVRLRLDDGLALEGTVVDEAGKPAIARITAMERNDFDESHGATSSAEGHFRITGLIAGPHAVHAENKEGSTDKEVTLPTRDAIRLVLERFGAISGIVVDASQKPVADAEVVAFAKETRGGSATSDPKGAFTFSDLKRGASYTLLVIGPEGARDSEPVKAASGQSGVTLVVKPSAKIRGRVIGDGRKPLIDAFVNGHPVDSAGRFELRLGKGPTMDVRATADGYAGVTKEVRVEGKDVDVGDVQLGGRTLLLRVVDASTGKALSKASVWIASDWTGGHGEAAAWTDSDGKATVRGLPIAHAVLTINHNTHSPQTVTIEDAANEKTVRLEAGATVEVKVSDAAGKPVATRVMGLDLETGRAVTLSADMSGAVKFEGMPKGKWTFSARELRGAARAQQTVQIPEAGVVPVALVLKAGSASVSLVFAATLASADSALFVFPPGTRAPANGSDLTQLWSMASEAREVGDRFVVDGLDVGTHLAVVLKQGANGMQMFSVPFEVTAAPQQAVTLREGTWVNVKLE